MESFQQSIRCLVTAAVICGVLLQFVHDGPLIAWLRTVCGVFLVIVFVYPFVYKDWKFETINIEESTSDGAALAASGQDMARQQTIQFIKEETEAYILGIAEQMGADILVTVKVNNEYLPHKATIHGNVTAQVKDALSRMLVNDLNIAKENQRWSG